MQPNPDSKQPERASDQPKTPAGANINLSLSDLLPGVFDEMPPMPKVLSRPDPAAPSAPAKPNSRPQARNWVAANFEQSAAGLPTSQTSSLKCAPTLTRLRRSLPLLNRIKAGRWLIFVAIALLVISIMGLLAWLYYNNIVGAVPPSNGPLEAYPGATRLDVNQKASNYIFEVEKDLPVLKGAIGVPSVTSDSPAKITSFYSHLMSTKGYTAVASQSFGVNTNLNTLLGPLNVLYYTKNKEVARVELVTLAANVDDLHLHKGEVVIILATGQA